MQEGKFYGIGVGPGDPALLTVKAVDRLKRLDLLYVPAARQGADSLALTIVKDFLPENLEVRKKSFPMTRDPEAKAAAWEAIASEIRAELAAGKQVGFVTLGDPMVYSTYSYILERLDGYARETLAGISSFSQMANALQIPLVKEEESLAVLPALAPQEDLANALDHFSTIVIMKVYSKAQKVYDLLAARDLLDQAVLVSEASQAGEQVRKGLGDWDPDQSLSYFSTLIVYKNRNLE